MAWRSLLGRGRSCAATFDFHTDRNPTELPVMNLAVIGLGQLPYGESSAAPPPKQAVRQSMGLFLFWKSWWPALLEGLANAAARPTAARSRLARCIQLV